MDLQSERHQKNIDLLFEGYWYDDLPPVIDITTITRNLREVIRKINDDEYGDLKKNSDGLIVEFKEITSPSYIFNDGIETISFFDFKKNGALREIQIPNLKYYCAFVYNVMNVYDTIIKKLYQGEEFSEYVENSNSYILFNQQFHIHRGYDVEEVIDSGVFAVKNNKTTGQLAYEENSKRYLKKQSAYMYSVKVDLESFYANIYTHYLGKIKNMEPFNKIPNSSDFFEFLDYYNMKINNNQTKGIITGVFSSAFSSELLMLCVDYEIKNAIGDDVEYIRYVDDLSFFSDSLEDIRTKLHLVQKILNKYRLRINSNKTEESKAIYNSFYVDIYNLKKEFSFFDFISDSIGVKLEKEMFYNIKQYISNNYDQEKKSEIKAFLVLLKKAISNEKLIVNSEVVDNAKYLAFYMLQLACLEPIFSSRCYRVVEIILEKLQGKREYTEIIDVLKRKNKFINDTYNDSVLQIWHYYVLSKYDMNFKFDSYLNEFGNDEVNPIILAMFVKDGNNKNRDIIDYIKKNYDRIEGTEVEPNKWQTTVMYSKWWLPLFVIYKKDKKNYHKFFLSARFPKIYKDMLDENMATNPFENDNV